MSQEQAKQGKQSLDEGQSLRQRLGTPQWREADWGRVDGVLATSERRLMALWEAQIRLTRLLTLLFGTRRRRKSSGSSPSSGDEDAATDRSEDDVCGEQARPGGATRGASVEGGPQDDGTPPRTGGHRPGEGRRGAAADASAERVECRHEAWAAGQLCPVCGQGR